MIRTSETHPIRVDAIPVRKGLLGLTFCPGKHGDSLNGAPWARDLEVDLAALKAWGAGLVVTLMERHEFAILGVPDLDTRIAAHGMDWEYLPIPDQGTPKGAFEAAWPEICAELLARFETGGRVILHCRGGLGRTGLVAALLLIEAGMPADEAIRAVRRLRPRAIETTAQEIYVRGYVPSKVCPEADRPQLKLRKEIKMDLEKIRQAHIKHGHHEQAGRIAERLKARFPALEISDAEDAEAGRYVAVYVTLVPETVRMMIQLKDSDQNHHVYQLRGAAESKADGARFEEFMKQKHNDIDILNPGSPRPYVRVPSWKGLFTTNEEHEMIAKQVLIGLAFIAKLSNLDLEA